MILLKAKSPFEKEVLKNFIGHSYYFFPLGQYMRMFGWTVLSIWPLGYELYYMPYAIRCTQKFNALPSFVV
jgi:hypothetical protein